MFGELYDFWVEFSSDAGVVGEVVEDKEVVIFFFVSLLEDFGDCTEVDRVEGGEEFFLFSGPFYHFA